MQPTYLPWAGYFNLISAVDVFVFLDDVQFQRQSWQTRNRILLEGRETLLTVPVNKAPLDTKVKDITINHQNNWLKKHWQSLLQAYNKCRYGSDALSLVEPFYISPVPQNLAEFNERIISRLARSMELFPRFINASELGCGSSRSSHLIEIINRIGADEYISPEGSRQYLLEDKFEEHLNGQLTIKSFTPEEYAQPNVNKFVSHLSVIDVVANIGLEQTATYIQ